MVLCLENMRDAGQISLSLQHKIEHDFDGRTPGLTGVNYYFAFARWNQSLTDQSSDIIDLTLRTVPLPFEHRVDEMEAIRVPDDCQQKFPKPSKICLNTTNS
jgi:hypothetical protein